MTYQIPQKFKGYPLAGWGTTIFQLMANVLIFSSSFFWCAFFSISCSCRERKRGGTSHEQKQKKHHGKAVSVVQQIGRFSYDMFL